MRRVKLGGAYDYIGSLHRRISIKGNLEQQAAYSLTLGIPSKVLSNPAKGLRYTKQRSKAALYRSTHS